MRLPFLLCSAAVSLLATACHPRYPGAVQSLACPSGWTRGPAIDSTFTFCTPGFLALSRDSSSHIWYDTTSRGPWSSFEVRMLGGPVPPTISRELVQVDSVARASLTSEWVCRADCATYTDLVQLVDTVGGRPISVEQGRLFGTLEHLEGTLIRRYVSRQNGAQWLVIEVRCHTPDAVTLFHTVVASIHWLDPALAAT